MISLNAVQSISFPSITSNTFFLGQTILLLHSPNDLSLLQGLAGRVSGEESLKGRYILCGSLACAEFQQA